MGLASSSTARADVTWDNDSANFLWGTPANWSGNTLPISTDTAVLTDNSAGTIDLGGVNRSINTLRFTDTSATGYLLNTGSLTLNLIDQAGAGSANNQINSNVTAAGSTLTMALTSGMLDVNGKVTAMNLAVTPLVAGNGAVALRNTTNSIGGTISISNSGNLHAVEAGSLGTATVALNGSGTLQLLSDTANATYGNNVSVAGSGNTITADAYLGGVLDTTLHLGTLNVGATNLGFQTRSGYQIGFNSTTLNGNATFSSSLLFDTDHPSKMSLGTVSQAGASSITLNGTGSLILDGVGSYTGGTTVNGGMVTATVNGALGTAGNVEVYTDGTINLAAAQSPFRPILAGKNGEKYAAVAGNLTGAIYSGGSQNVTLASDSILAITAGPSPIRGVDVSGANYYQGITSNSQIITVGDDGATSIYKGAAFGPYTPSGASPIPFAGTISGIGPSGLQIYMGTGNKQIDGATLNSSDAIAHFFGPGGVTLITHPVGTATTYTHVGNGNSTSQSTFLVTLQGHNILTSANVLNVSDGIFFPDSPDSIRDSVGFAGATVNIGSGGTAYLYGLFPNAGLTGGTVNVSSGGAIYIAASSTKPNAGANWNFSPGSLVILGSNVNTGSPSSWIPSVSDVVVDMSGNASFTGQGVVIGNGRRLTTANNRAVTLTGGSGIKAAGGASGVIFTASGNSGSLTIQDNVALTNIDLQVGDTASFTTTNFTTRVSAPQAGNVRIDGSSNSINNLTIKAGNLSIGDQSSDVTTLASITQNSSGTTTLQDGAINLGFNIIVNSGNLNVASKINYGSISSVNVNGGALSFNITNPLAAPTFPSTIGMNGHSGPH